MSPQNHGTYKYLLKSQVFCYSVNFHFIFHHDLLHKFYILFFMNKKKKKTFTQKLCEKAVNEREREKIDFNDSQSTFDKYFSFFLFLSLTHSLFPSSFIDKKWKHERKKNDMQKEISHVYLMLVKGKDWRIFFSFEDTTEGGLFHKWKKKTKKSFCV